MDGRGAEVGAESSNCGEGFVRVAEMSSQREDVVDREEKQKGKDYDARQTAAGLSTRLDARRIRLGCDRRTVA